MHMSLATDNIFILFLHEFIIHLFDKQKSSEAGWYIGTQNCAADRDFVYNFVYNFVCRNGLPWI